MAYDFPPSPAIGDQANGYQWDGVIWNVIGAPDTGGGGGGGDDLDTTPVAAIGSTHPQSMPNWLAGAPIIELLGDAAVGPAYRGCWLHMMNDVGSLVLLPDDWLPGQCFGVRQIGLGQVMYQIEGGATMQMPSTRGDHTILAERYEEAVFKVVGLSGGSSGYSIWTALGGTA